MGRGVFVHIVIYSLKQYFSFILCASSPGLTIVNKAGWKKSLFFLNKVGKRFVLQRSNTQNK